MDVAIIYAKMEVVEEEGRGGVTYEDSLGFFGVDSEEPLVTSGGKLRKVLLEEVSGALEGGGKGEEGGVISRLRRWTGGVVWGYIHIII